MEERQGNPAVSVLMPVYNAERFLPLAVQSVLDQTFADFELIAVDDGSKDNSGAMLQGFARRDPRVKVISRPNTGIVGALNDALAAAKGELIARMDSDDLCLPERFAAQVKYMTEHPEVVLLGTQVMVIDEDGDAIAPLRGLYLEHEKIERSLLDADWPMVHPSVMIRASALRAIGGYEQGTFPHEDHDLFSKLGEQGRVANLDQVLLKYRRHSTSISWNAQSRAKLLEVLKKACVRRGVEYVVPPLRGKENVSDRRRRQELCRNWGWQALQAGNLATARKYATRALKAGPLSAETWKLMACTVRGH
ncbi:MAG TPA: glycosyltransferase [Tepidisphaeraceae bacterium]|nr:glycosyltransferase [Tepidisphaeraceae bacterium]